MLWCYHEASEARTSSTVIFHLASTVSHRLERKHASISLFGCIACTEKKKRCIHFAGKQTGPGPQCNMKALGKCGYLGSGRMIFLLARAAGVDLLFSIAIK